MFCFLSHVGFYIFRSVPFPVRRAWPDSGSGFSLGYPGNLGTGRSTIPVSDWGGFPFRIGEAIRCLVMFRSDPLVG